MQLRADYTPGYFRRFLWIALACAAFAGWCFYDGLVVYPKKLDQAKVYWALDEATRDKQWRDITAANQWPPSPPDPTKEINGKIQSQFFMAGVCIVIGTFCLLKWLLAKGSWVENTETGLRTSRGKQVQFDQIESIDKTRWEKKGIAKIRYQDNSKAKSFVLDDFKYDRAVMGKILRLVESHLSAEQIVGGPPEPDDDESDDDGEPSNVAEGSATG